MNITKKELLLLGIFITAVVPSIFNLGFEATKVIWFILITLFLAYYLKDRSILKLSKIKILSIIFFTILSVTSFFGVDPQISILGAYPYYQGFITYIFLGVFAYLISISKFGLKDFSRPAIISSLVVSLIALIEFTILTFTDISISNYSGRAISTFGQSNFYAGFLVIALPFIALEDKKSWLKYLCLGLASAAVLVSFSKGAIFILYLQAVFFLIHKALPKYNSLLKFSAVAIVTAIIAGGYIMTNNILEGTYYYQGRLEGMKDLSSENRSIILPLMGEVAKTRPLLGFGLENIDLATKFFFQGINFNTNSNPTYLTLKDMKIDRSHNYFLDLVITSGVFSALIWLLLILFLFYKSKSSAAMVLSLGSFFVFSMIHNLSIVHLIQFWLLVGLIDKSSD